MEKEDRRRQIKLNNKEIENNGTLNANLFYIKKYKIVEHLQSN